LNNNIEKSGVDMNYVDPFTNDKFVPHVIEPTFGISRLFTIILMNAYTEEQDRVVLKLPKNIAPYKAAVFPLVKNKEDIVNKARDIFETLVTAGISTAWDDRGNIGKRYYSQDEIGTPSCITIDYQTLEDNTVTVRDRDTTKQDRVRLEDLINRL
jgi:glycyl-tRNA synthetase